MIVLQCIKKIGNPIPNTQHWLILYKVTEIIKPSEIQFKRRCNFKRWIGKFFKGFRQHDNFNVFMVKSISRKNIPTKCIYSQENEKLPLIRTPLAVNFCWGIEIYIQKHSRPSVLYWQYGSRRTTQLIFYQYQSVVKYFSKIILFY